MIPVRGSTIIIPDMMVLFIMAVLSILSIASNSIGIEAFNKNETWKTEKPTNFSFLIFNLIISIGLLILSGGALIYNFIKK
jgi:hypothetical protein